MVAKQRKNCQPAYVESVNVYAINSKCIRHGRLNHLGGELEPTPSTSLKV
jgi:hypothetical protein